MRDAVASTRTTRALPYLFGLLAGIIVGLSGLLYLTHAGRLRLGPLAPTAVSPDPEALRESRRTAIVGAVAKTRRSVVTISAVGPREVYSSGEELLWVPFRPHHTQYFRWVGSGFLIDAGGYIITNEHVVRGASEIVVSMGDGQRGTSAPARVVGRAPEFDLALLQVPDLRATGLGLGGEESLLVPAQLGDSDQLLVGEWAIAIGSPFGNELDDTEPSVSVGVISAVQRDLPSPDEVRAIWPYLKMIQTDAAIHDGNSGGPLVNAAGEVIGVNTARFSNQAPGGGGLGFSIPINTVKWVWQDLRDFHEVRKAWIGWVVKEVDPAVRLQLQLPEEEGVLTVSRVVHGSPADRAGIREGDIIQNINGMEAYSLARADRILFGTPVGGRVNVELLGRDGHLRRVMVDVVEDPSSQAEREARTRQRLG